MNWDKLIIGTALGMLTVMTIFGICFIVYIYAQVPILAAGVITFFILSYLVGRIVWQLTAD